jgi:hypothetical protein
VRGCALARAHAAAVNRVAPGYAARREDEGGESGSGICVSNRVSWRLRRPWSLVLPQDGQEIRAGWTRRRGRCSGNSERVRDFNCSSQGHRIEYDALGRCSSMVERPNRSWQMWRSIPSAGPKSVRLEVEAALDDRHHPGKGADDHDRRHGMVDVAGVQEGEGPGVSARMFGRSGFWPTTLVNMAGRGACVPRQVGPGHGLRYERKRSCIRCITWSPVLFNLGSVQKNDSFLK